MFRVSTGMFWDVYEEGYEYVPFLAVMLLIVF